MDLQKIEKQIKSAIEQRVLIAMAATTSLLWVGIFTTGVTASIVVAAGYGLLNCDKNAQLPDPEPEET